MENLEDKIERFLNNEMDVNEVADFKNLVKSDYSIYTSVVEAAKLNKALSQIISGNVDQAKIEKMQSLEKTIEKIASEYKLKQTKRSRPAVKWVAAAALAVIILFLGKVYLLDGSRYDTLYSEYYKPVNSFFNLEPNFKLKDTSLVSSFMKLYDNQNFSEYISKYYNVSKGAKIDSSDQTIISFYAGVSFMEKGEHKKAVGQFKNIKKSDRFYNESQWLMALSCIKEDDIKNAKYILETIVSNGTDYADEAKSILNDLN